MRVFSAADHGASEFKESLQQNGEVLVTCLCAQWCGTCRSFNDIFSQLAVALPQATWLWLDVEDDSEVVGDIDVENFPTLLIQRGTQLHFFGTSLPLEGVVRRMVENALESPERAIGTITPELDFFSRMKA